MYLYQYFKEWRKNPQWSFSCCLALLLPLNDLQGEIHGMVGQNLLKTQLCTGVTEKPSIAACAKDSGAMDFTLSHGETEANGESTTTLREQNFEATVNTKTKCHRWTQTEIFNPPFAATFVHGSLEGNQYVSL